MCLAVQSFWEGRAKGILIHHNGSHGFFFNLRHLNTSCFLRLPTFFYIFKSQMGGFELRVSGFGKNQHPFCSPLPSQVRHGSQRRQHHANAAGMAQRGGKPLPVYRLEIRGRAQVRLSEALKWSLSGQRQSIPP